ncbi:MAG: pyridoxamine 5'-phosphate oxidase [Rhodothermia bacterium]|nr:pyridoxamine 5'-phosphate oxidase [Rhodothermia bacterium]
MSLRSLLRSVRTLGRGVAVGIPDPSEHSNPVDLFRVWLEAAEESGILEPTAMTLATSDATGRPSARTVLLKSVDDRGFVFYTNYGSRKAADLDQNPRAALVFHWKSLLRQVIVEGYVDRATRTESEEYFATRPRGSRLAAWASRQSEKVESRESLVERFEQAKDEHAGRDVDLPPFWGGYRVVPNRIEFWQGRPNRLHDRILFERTDNGWKTSRLYP